MRYIEFWTGYSKFYIDNTNDFQQAILVDELNNGISETPYQNVILTLRSHEKLICGKHKKVVK